MVWSFQTEGFHNTPRFSRELGSGEDLYHDKKHQSQPSSETCLERESDGYPDDNYYGEDEKCADSSEHSISHFLFIFLSSSQMSSSNP